MWKGQKRGMEIINMFEDETEKTNQFKIYQTYDPIKKLYLVINPIVLWS